MTKGKAIKTHCFWCSGDSNKEVTLCTSFDCPLWEYRTGAHITSTSYRKRMLTALQTFREELLPEDYAKFSQSYKGLSSKTRSHSKKSAQTGQDRG